MSDLRLIEGSVNKTVVGSTYVLALQLSFSFTFDED